MPANNNQRTGLCDLGKQKKYTMCTFVCKMKSERRSAQLFVCGMLIAVRFPASRFSERTILSKDGRFFSGCYTPLDDRRPFRTHRFAHRRRKHAIFRILLFFTSILKQRELFISVKSINVRLAFSRPFRAASALFGDRLEAAWLQLFEFPVHAFPE